MRLVLLRARTLLALSFSFFTGALLSGCGVNTLSVAAPEPAAAIHGTLMGGRAPITGATISLMEAGIAGYGSAPSLLSTTTSLSDGSFSLPAHGTCPTPDRLVYIQAVGGNSGTNSGVNTAIDLVALLGPCTQVGGSTKVAMNEATTISAAYALAQFASVTTLGTGIGTSSTNVTGLNNALGPANLLVNYATGDANPTSTAAGVVLPSTVVNTLADILASCTNSAIASSGNCTTLFNATTVNAVKPIDTFQAALNMALHPGANVPTLFGLVSSTGPFQPTIPTNYPPSDLTVAIGFTGGGASVYGTNAVAIDAEGNAWATTYYTNAAQTESGLIEITPTGQFPGGTTGFGNTFLGGMNGMAIDPQGNIWVGNAGDQQVTGVTPSGNLLTSAAAPLANGLAVDGSGDIWFSNGGDGYDTFSEVVNAGGGSYTTGPTLTAGAYFGVDVCLTPGYVWEMSIGNSSQASQVTQYNTATQTTNTIVPDNGYAYVATCAVDNTGNVYLADSSNAVVYVVNSSGSITNTYDYTASGVYPQELAIDGLGNIFLGNYVPQSVYSYDQYSQNPGTVVEMNSAGTVTSPASGYAPTTGQTGGINPGLVGLTSEFIPPDGVAIDGSGNVWLAGNDGQSVPSTGNVNTGNLPVYVTEIVGLAAPVMTPKSVALKNGMIATRP